MTKRRIAAVVQGMALTRACAYDDGARLPVERLKNGDVILRLSLTGVSAETYQAIKTALAGGGTPWLVLDRSGAVVSLYKNALNGRGIENLSMEKILETLPPADELPEDFTWTDFTKQQLAALLLMADITSQNTRDQQAALVGVTAVTLWRWEGQGKFLKAKQWLLERSAHRIREQFYRNLGVGAASPDDQLRLAYTKMAGEKLGELGRRQEQGAGAGKNESELAANLAALAPSTRAALGNEFRVMAALLDGQEVRANESGTLVAGNPKPEARMTIEARSPKPESGESEGSQMGTVPGSGTGPCRGIVPICSQEDANG